MTAQIPIVVIGFSQQDTNSDKNTADNVILSERSDCRRSGVQASNRPQGGS